MASDVPPTPRVALVVGAGGPTGGPFIWAALDALEARTGWTAAAASTIVGTSAGAFVAARIGEPVEPSPGAVEQLVALRNGRAFQPTIQTRIAATVRSLGGRVVAAIAPMGRPRAEYLVPEGPVHRGASAVTVRRRTGARVQHRLHKSADPTAVVRASAAIPGVNQPIEVDGALHVDGAVHSANNVDLVDPATHPVLVVISPMVPQTGGSLVSRFHCAQLRRELSPWLQTGRTAVVVMPSPEAHAERRNRELYETEGRLAVERLTSAER